MSEHELWNELGNLYFLCGAYNQAANAYQRSIQADTEFGRPYSNLALTYVQQGRYDDAIELYRRSIELLADATEKAVSLNRLGGVYRHLKDYSKAVVAFQQADQLDPRSADEFPPAAPPRAQEAPAPSPVLNEPVADIIYDAYPPVEAVNEAPVAETVTETIVEPVAETEFERVETMTEIPVAEIVETPVAETSEEPAAEEPVIEAIEESVAEAPLSETIEEPVAEEPVLYAVAEAVSELPMAEAAEPPVAEAPFVEVVEVPAAEATAAEATEKPVAEAEVLEIVVEAVAEVPVAEAIAETVAEVAVAEAVVETVAEAPALQIAEEPIAEMQVIAAIEESATEMFEEAVAAVAEKTTVAAPEPTEEDIVYEPSAEAQEEAPAEAIAESETLEEKMTRRMDFLVGEALDQARMEIAEQPSVDSDEPEIEPDLEWWDVEEERFEAATGTQTAHAGPMDNPSTSWTAADLSQFQQDVSLMPDSGSLTTWGDTDLDDDFERWSPMDPVPDVEEPDPDSEDISTWLPVPEDTPVSFEHVPPFVDELDDEPEPPSDWETLPRYRPVKSEPAPRQPASTSMPAPAEVPVHNEAALKQTTWEPRVDVAVEERPAKDYTVVPQERPSRVEVEPAPRPAQPQLVLAPAMPLPAPVETPRPDRDEDEMREIEMGIEKFRRVVQLNPANARAWDSLGSLYKSAGMYRDAILAYQQAISHDGTKSLYHHHLGLVYACEHRDADAIAAFQRVIEIDPEYSLAHATLGGYYRKMGLEELAQKHIGKAMKNIFDSENEYNRACLEAICGNAEQAIKLLDVALKNKQTYVDWILRDPDLDFIRQDPRFKQLISRYTR